MRKFYPHGRAWGFPAGRSAGYITCNRHMTGLEREIAAWGSILLVGAHHV